MLRNKFRLVLASACLVAAMPAAASEPIGERSPAAALATKAVTDGGETLSNGELGLLRGGQGIVVSNQTLVAVTSGNVINGDYTAGSVSLSDNAFSNFSGMGNVLINTGAQVSLQTGMNVTINVGE
jgi:hypothetical protein